MIRLKILRSVARMRIFSVLFPTAYYKIMFQYYSLKLDKYAERIENLLYAKEFSKVNLLIENKVEPIRNYINTLDNFLFEENGETISRDVLYYFANYLCNHKNLSNKNLQKPKQPTAI